MSVCADDDGGQVVGSAACQGFGGEFMKRGVQVRGRGEILNVLIDQLRVAIPEEVKQARRINQESDRVLSKAREEAEQIIGAAQEQAALLLQDQSILREAETRSQDVLDKAQAKAEETMHGADQYAADVLVRLESDLVKTLSVIKKSLEVLEERRAAPTEG